MNVMMLFIIALEPVSLLTLVVQIMKIGIAFVCVLVIFGEAHATEWCSTRTMSYTRCLQVPVKVCRHVIDKMTKPIRMRSLSSKPFIKMFPGLFFNKTTANELDKEMNKMSVVLPQKRLLSRKVGLRSSLYHDGDLHCPTFKKIQTAPDKMRNIRQEMKEIVHFSSEGVYQYLIQGKCRSGSIRSCSGGWCHQEKSIAYLMVWQDNPDWPIGFEPFEMDSYCSCKGISP